MQYVRCTDLRRNMSQMLDLVEKGERIMLMRRGKPVALLVPVEEDQVPRWKKPVQAIKIQGEPLSETIIKERRGE